MDGRFSSGMWVGQQALPAKQRVAGFYEVEEARKNPALFAAWLKKAEPDVIFTLYHVVKTWIEGLGMKVPRDIGLIQLEHREDCKDWAGMDQHNDQTGEGAVDMLVGMVHNNEIGLPAFPRATLISGSWVEGETVRSRASRAI